MATAAATQTKSNIGRLLEPAQIGKLTLKNRIVMGPMAAISGAPDGRPSDQTVAFLAARARGGVGMIIVGGTVGTARGVEEAPFKGLIRADKEEFLPDFKRVADAVHAHGTPIIGEIAPAFGRMGVPAPGRPLIAASPVNVVIPKGPAMPIERVTDMPEEATVEQIKGYERETIEAALRLRRAGWDGVELAAHMSYFLASFLTPRTNHRTDEYGGSVANRARMLVNIVRAVREAAGPDFVIGLRLSSNEYVPGGQEAPGYAAIAQEVAAHGLDYIAPTAGCYESINETVDGGRLMLQNGDIAAFRKALSLPLLLMGIHDPEEAAQTIVDGDADLIMLARPMLADPDYANKLANGRPDEIVRCDASNHCIRRLMMHMPVRCRLNPRMGREHEIANGAPLHDRSVRRLMEDAALNLVAAKPVMAVAGALMGAKGKKRSEAKAPSA